MKTLFVVLVLVGGLAARSAHGGSAYDWQSGNMYNWNQGLGGDTNVRGYNPGTGSQWNTTVRPNGDMRGFDANGNYWNYNARSGSYWNTNGRGCIGHGAGRVCY